MLPTFPAMFARFNDALLGTHPIADALQFLGTLIYVITNVTLRMTPLMTTHEPPSSRAAARAGAVGAGCRDTADRACGSEVLSAISQVLVEGWAYL